ncbi:hypothetical protein OO012_19885, partial [Rhodobacteraceae bacterium KMM 6894]|nr:hypothetical protein [Rhodobacteraceae bacterium KMM 6894]
MSSGNYGALNVSNKSYSSHVTLVSAEPRGAVFTSVKISNTNYLRVDNVHVDNPDNGGTASKVVSVTNGSSHIEFLNSEVNGKVDGDFSGHYGLYSNKSSDVTFEGNFVHDVKVGAVFNAVEDVTVRGNSLEDIGSDNFKFSSIKGALIEGNLGSRNFHPQAGDHIDFIQFQPNGNSSDIVIRGNVSMPSNIANMQGIYLGAV